MLQFLFFILWLILLWAVIAAGYYAKQNFSVLKKILEKLNDIQPEKNSATDAQETPATLLEQPTEITCPYCVKILHMEKNFKGTVLCPSCKQKLFFE